MNRKRKLNPNKTCRKSNWLYRTPAVLIVFFSRHRTIYIKGVFHSTAPGRSVARSKNHGFRTFESSGVSNIRDTQIVEASWTHRGQAQGELRRGGATVICRKVQR